jgi:hypothetical protein
MAPEILMDRQYDNLVDIWSIGIIMYILESGGGHPLLFKPKTRSEFIEDIKLKKDFYFPNHFPLVARNIFLKMCKYEPCFRYNVTKSLSHPWITRKNINIPLNVIEDFMKEEKIKNFKEMLISMIFVKQFKKIFNFRIVETENNNEFDIVKRKLNIKKGNIAHDLYPSPFNNLYSIRKSMKSNSIRELPTLTRPSSNKDRIKNYKSNINKSILRLKSFNTDKKISLKHSIYSKNSSGTQSKTNIKKSNTIKIRNSIHNKKNYIKNNTKSRFKLVNLKGPYNNNNVNLPSTIPGILIGSNSQQMRTPILLKKQLSRNFDNNKYLTMKMMKNKENININYIYNNHNVINNYSNKKVSNNNCFKAPIKMNIIEPKNLFQKSSNNNLIIKNNSEYVKKIF